MLYGRRGIFNPAGLGSRQPKKNAGRGQSAQEIAGICGIARSAVSTIVNRYNGRALKSVALWSVWALAYSSGGRRLKAKFMALSSRTGKTKSASASGFERKFRCYKLAGWDFLLKVPLT
ncbi:MAG: hypothetical protein Pg6C_06500 [Treponemataceae bacterium]|nr:MAG: hypothetical protein Pg6C_06500 [Treponemataceae bacterium]